ncbi:ribonuclease H-like domain-containing protein [Tanacetum coccineum]|uniref:Ribonuclease H-like domain-containing protein n=1 Tax=Tanacetum coccineum TaxID=301880 RepID=A0ABQ5CH88_9ASTR
MMLILINVHVSTASSIVSTDSTHDNTANLSDAIVYAFLANQPNRSQLVHEDLEQIHENDLEEMDLKWKLALLSMRARRYYQRTGKKITINGNDTAGYDKSKVECFNCHKMGHFARECRGPRNQQSRARNQDNSRRTVNVDDTSSKAMVAIDGAGFDWSYMVDEEVPTNLAFMAFSDSEVHISKTCSNTYLKSFETLKTRLDNLRVEFNKSDFNIATYKRGLASVEEQLVFYKNNEIEKLKKEKESNQIKIDNFENAFKSLDKLIGSQISDNNRKGVGLFKANKGVCENSSNEVKKSPDALIIEDWVSDCDEDEFEVRILKSDNVQQKPKQADQPRKVSENHRNNRTKWNEKKIQKLGIIQKPMMNNVKKGTGQREVRPVWNNAMRINHQNFSNSRRNFAPTAVLTKSGKVPISTARQSSSRAAAPVSTAKPINTAAPKSFVNVAKTRPNAFQKSHSPSRRPFYQQTALKNRNLNDKVNTAKVNFVNTAKGNRVTSAIGEQGINAVKSSACWVWRPKIKVLDHISKNSGSYSCLELKDKKELAIPGQTTTGKEFSNPLMADSLPKTILPIKFVG